MWKLGIIFFEIFFDTKEFRKQKVWVTQKPIFHFQVVAPCLCDTYFLSRLGDMKSLIDQINPR